MEAHAVLLCSWQSLLSLNGPFNHSIVFVLFVSPPLLKKILRYFLVLNFGYISSIQVLIVQISIFLTEYSTFID